MKMGRRFAHLQILAFLFVLSYPQITSVCLSQDIRVEHRRALVETLNTQLLGKLTAVKLDEGGWRASALAVPGAPLSPVITAFDPHGFTSTSLAQLYENMALFDRSLSVENGIAITNEGVVPSVWDDLIRRTLPPPISPDEQSAATSAGALIFRQGDSVDAVRRIEYLNEPSQKFKRYREYELLYRLVFRAKLDDDGAWRLHPRLSNFASLAEAEETILSDWSTFGHRQEIELALADYKKRTNAERWQLWTRARKKYDNNTFPIDAYQSVAQTFLYPPASSWLTLSSWMRLRVNVGGSECEYELLRVKVMRPWMSLSELLQRKFTLNPDLPGNDVYTLTDGKEPSFEAFPKGRLAVFAEELLLVRNVRWTNNAPVQEHPLGTVASPEAINLLGYVCRVLPEGLLK